MNNFQAHFNGFYNTPHLFKMEVLGMIPYVFTLSNSLAFNTLITKNYRLGQLVERFVVEELRQNENTHLLVENHQVNYNNITVGELDAIFIDKTLPIHLEIQFKFYLYVPDLGKTEIENCIGPNRRDSLIEKLDKLKKKQLPLLYKKETKSLLEKLQLKAEQIKQKIYFKAQLFLPYDKKITFKTLNNDCIYGFYFNYNELNHFRHCKFYLPKKIDWLLDINVNVNWKTIDVIKPNFENYYLEKYAPLVWLKFPNDELNKCFVIYW